MAASERLDAGWSISSRRECRALSLAPRAAQLLKLAPATQTIVRCLRPPVRDLDQRGSLLAVVPTGAATWAGRYEMTMLAGARSGMP